MRVKFYLCAYKGALADLLAECLEVKGKPEEEALYQKFKYALMEVGTDLEVNMDTGEVKLIAVEGVPLERPVKVR